MNLAQLLSPDYFVPPEWDKTFERVVTDSRDIRAGDVFMLARIDSTRRKIIINEALKQNPAAILVDEEEGFSASDEGIPVFSLPNLSQHIQRYLQVMYPLAKNMRLVGVTGTNGKSSITHYLAQILNHSDKGCALIGTLGNGVYPNLETTRNTTSDLATSLSILDNAYKQGADYAAIEVSSHGIAQKRLQGLGFEVAVFSNLSQDHLDYHGSMEAYFAVKKRFVIQSNSPKALVCIDDEYGKRLFAEVTGQEAFSYGQHEQADIRYSLIHTSSKGLSIEIVSPWGQAQVVLPLLGEFNAANAVAGLACACMLGVNFTQAINALSSLQAVSGRMQVLVNQQRQITAVIDFAHTPDALMRALKALNIDGKKPNLVFGCGGNRDKSKRPQMAQAAFDYANQVWLTDDNPRDENPDQIFHDAIAVIPNNNFNLEHKRELAIAQAVEQTNANELLLIAGKGHEEYQEINGVRHAYSDYTTLVELGFSPLHTESKGGIYAN